MEAPLLNIHRLKFPAIFCTLIALPLLFMALGCAPGKGVSEDFLNTPEHHIASGYKLLKKDYLFHAEREFNLALQLDADAWNAQRGLGLTYARKGQFDLALSHMKKAEQQAKTDETRALVNVGFMRIYLLEGNDGWADKVTRHYAEAISNDPSLPEAHFYMGMAYKRLDRLPEARAQFNKVLAIDKGLISESQDQLRDLDLPEKRP